MIIWLTGQTGAGKTTLAQKIGNCNNTVILDGDELREVWENSDLSEEGRWEQNIRVAKLAKLLENQGLSVVVAVICPYKKLRDEVRRITNCFFIYVQGGHVIDADHPYEIPEVTTKDDGTSKI